MAVKSEAREVTVRRAPKVCEVCGTDISHRTGPAKYCVPCSLLTKRQRALVKAGVLTVEEATAQRGL